MPQLTMILLLLRSVWMASTVAVITVALGHSRVVLDDEKRTLAIRAPAARDAVALAKSLFGIAFTSDGFKGFCVPLAHSSWL
jgi:hypothetical protein